MEEETNTHKDSETLQLLRRSNRALRMFSKCNEAVLHASDEQELLSKICNIIVSDGGYRFAWIGYVENNEARTIRPVGQCGFEDGYIETLCVSWEDDEFGRGPTGKAIRTGRPSVAADIHSDPDYALWRPEAIRRGYASSIAVPLIIDSRVIGTLNIYASEPFFFGEDETAMLMNLGNNLSYGISSLRTRAKLIRSEQLLKEAQSIGTMGSWELDLLTNTLVWSDEIYNIFNINPAKFGASYEHFLNTVHPEDRAMVDQAYSDSVKNKTQYDIVHRLLMPDGRIKFVHERCKTFYDEKGTPLRSAGTVQDITDRKKTEEIISRHYDTQRVINSMLQMAVMENISLNEIIALTLQLIFSIPWLTFESIGAIYLAEEATDNLKIVAQKGLDGFTLKACSVMPFGTCLCGRAAASQEIVFASSVDDRHDVRYENMAHHGHYCVPIVFSGKTLGLINIYLRDGHPDDTEEREFLCAVANCLAGIIQRKRTEDEKEKMRAYYCTE